MVEAQAANTFRNVGRRLASFAGGLVLAWMLVLLLCLAHAFYAGEFLGFLSLERRAALEPWVGLGDLSDGTVRRWKVQAGVGDGMLLTIALFTLLLFGLASYRRNRGPDGDTGARSGQRRRVAALGFLLLGLLPFWSLSLRRQELGTIVLLVDDSLSMNTVESVGTASPPRWEALQQFLLSPTIDSILDQHIVRLYTVGEVPRLVGTFSARQRETWRTTVQGLRPQGAQSRLGEGLRQILDAEQPAAVVFCTDGLVTGGMRLRDAATQARARRVPLILVSVGQEAPPGRVRIKSVRASDHVQAHDILLIDAELGAEGFLPGRGPVPVKLSLWDKELPQALEEQMVTLDPRGTLRHVRLRHQPTLAGKRTYQVRVDSPAPVSYAERTVQVLPVREIRALIIDSQPRYETRHLAAIWERQLAPHTNKATIQVHTRFLDMEGVELARNSGVRPSASLDVKPFQLVVLGDVDPQRLALVDQVALRDFVQRHGGSLIFLAGPRFTPDAWENSPLRELLPVERSARALPGVESGAPQQPRWLPRARRHALLRSLLEPGDPVLEPLRWVATGWQAKPAAELLAMAVSSGTPNMVDGLPLVVLARSGKGRCLFLGTEETWRWRAFSGVDWYERFWLQVLRYFTEQPGQQATLQCAQPLPVQPGEPLRIEAHFSGEATGAEVQERTLTVEWQPFTPAAGQAESQIVLLQELVERPGVCVWEEKSTRPGKYRFLLLSPPMKPVPVMEITVAPPPEEQTPAAPDLEALQEAAQAAEGHCLHLREAARLPGLLPVQSTVGIGAPVEVPLWNHPVFFVPLVLFLFAEWLRQRYAESG